MRGLEHLEPQVTDGPLQKRGAEWGVRREEATSSPGTKPAASSQIRVALVAAKTPLGLLLSWNPLLAPQKWLAVPVTPRSGAECRDD